MQMSIISSKEFRKHLLDVRWGGHGRKGVKGVKLNLCPPELWGEWGWVTVNKFRDHSTDNSEALSV